MGEVKNKQRMAMLAMIFGIISAGLNAFIFVFALPILASDISAVFDELAISGAVFAVFALTFVIVARARNVRGGRVAAGLINAIIGLVIIALIGCIYLVLRFG